MFCHAIFNVLIYIDISPLCGMCAHGRRKLGAPVLAGRLVFRMEEVKVGRSLCTTAVAG
jgi:hypothetical protein